VEPGETRKPDGDGDRATPGERRKPYASPELVEYGSILRLTEALGGTRAEGATGKPHPEGP
jgi:hypothetical protein